LTLCESEIDHLELKFKELLCYFEDILFVVVTLLLILPNILFARGFL